MPVRASSRVPSAIATDSTHVYWVEPGGTTGGIYRVPKP